MYPSPRPREFGIKAARFTRLALLSFGLAAVVCICPAWAGAPDLGIHRIHRDQGDPARRVAKDGDQPYHYGSKLVCSDCHVMHYSQSHGYNADGSGDFAPAGEAGPYGKLLRNDVTDLCLTCHDNHAGIPDVMGADVNGLAERSGASSPRSMRSTCAGTTSDATCPPWMVPTVARAATSEAAIR